MEFPPKSTSISNSRSTCQGKERVGKEEWV
jgi:hypothetical protein